MGNKINIPTRKEWAEMKAKLKEMSAPLDAKVDAQHQKIKDAIEKDMQKAFITGLLYGYLLGRKK